MKKFLNFFRSKVFLACLAVIIPVLIWLGLVFGVDIILMSMGYQSIGLWFWSLLGFEFLGVLLCIRIIMKDEYPMYKIVWNIFIICLPPIGIMAYFFFGRHKIRKRLRKNYLLSAIDLKLITEGSTYQKALKLSTSREPSNTCALLANSNYPAFPNTKTKYFGDISVLWPELITDLSSADKFIYMEMFIIKEGAFWSSIKEILIKKAKSNIDVRIIYDDFGTSLSNIELDELTSAGVKIYSFNKLGFSFDGSKNNRTHRKLIIVDGNVSYTGGFNIGDEYVGKVERFGVWKDSGMRFEGPGVYTFTSMFLSFWQLQKKIKPLDKNFGYAPALTCDFPEARGLVQPLASGPLGHNYRLIEYTFIQLISNAKKSIHISTPYLTLSIEIETALCLAAKCGVDVRIILPGIPDKKSVFEVSRSFYPNLLKAGIKIYEYGEGFMHSKEVIVDGKTAFIGTCNMDYRSFFLHFECGALLYDVDCIDDMETEFRRILDKSRAISLAWAQELKWYQRFWRSFAKIFAPLL